MRGAIWMALALLGTPLAALAQQQGTAGQQTTTAGPSGAASIEQGQDSVRAPGSFGVFGGPAIPGLGGVPMAPQPSTGAWWEGGTGGSGMNDSIGPTYRGTTQEMPSASPSSPYNFGGPSSTPGASNTAGSGNSTAGSSASGAASSGTQGNAQGNIQNNTSAGQSNDASLQQRVEALEREVSTLRGTGGSGTANTQTTASSGTQADDSEPVALVTVEFDGTVRNVTDKHIDVVDRTDGTLSRLTIDDQTRAYRGSPRKQIPLKQITEGARVQTSFAYISGVEHARDIVVQSSKRK